MSGLAEDMSAEFVQEIHDCVIEGVFCGDSGIVGGEEDVRGLCVDEECRDWQVVCLMCDVFIVQ